MSPEIQIHALGKIDPELERMMNFDTRMFVNVPSHAIAEIKIHKGRNTFYIEILNELGDPIPISKCLTRDNCLIGINLMIKNGAKVDDDLLKKIKESDTLTEDEKAESIRLAGKKIIYNGKKREYYCEIKAIGQEIIIKTIPEIIEDLYDRYRKEIQEKDKNILELQKRHELKLEKGREFYISQLDEKDNKYQKLLRNTMIKNSREISKILELMHLGVLSEMSSSIFISRDMKEKIEQYKKDLNDSGVEVGEE